MILDDILKILKNRSKNKAYTKNEKSYTYLEFYKFVCNIYEFLIENNKGKGPVIVFGNKEVYMKASFLACSFAGMTYVPIDSSMPHERVLSILKQVNPSLIIGDLEYDCKNITKAEVFEIMKNSIFKEIDEIYLKEDDIYYIIFTSGTTGVPKGVKVTYKNLDSCVRWLKNITKINNTTILNQAHYSFDLSVADLYLSLVTESEHFILEDNKMDFVQLFNQLSTSNAELAVMTPSFAELLMLDKKFNDKLVPLKQIIFCGEKLLEGTAEKIFERFENIKIINCYGPTECTFAVTSIEITKNMIGGRNIPVGYCKEGTEIIIVDENLEKLEDKKQGEILILGDSVASGYLNLDSKSFIKYNNRNGYLTGDIGYIENGLLYYVSRKDTQIKYKGYRIELLDIEENLYKLGCFERVEIIGLKDNNKNVSKILAFVKLKNRINVSEREIRKELKNKLPEYMCPVINITDEFPLNNNGKCDKNKLLEEYKNGRKNNTNI